MKVIILIARTYNQIMKGKDVTFKSCILHSAKITQKYQNKVSIDKNLKYF